MGAVTNRRRPHNHESMQIASPGKFADRPLPDANYRDCFRCHLQNPGKVSPNQVMAAFWTTCPAWLKFLFRLRDLLGQALRAENRGGPSREKLEEALNNGESCGFMSVAERTADETIVALDDKHLVAYMSVYIEGGQVFASTVVRYHNKLGVVYFNLIRPFHVLVVKNLFKQMMRERGF